MRTLRGAALAAVAGTALVGLTSCSFISPADPVRDDSGDIVASSDSDVFQVRVGDCLNVLELDEEVESVPTVPCSESHDGEVYASSDLPDGDFPGEEEIEVLADEYCYGEFAGFMGVAWENSELDFTYFRPTQDGWDRLDDRELLCIVVDPDGVTGTLEGSAR